MAWFISVGRPGGDWFITFVDIPGREASPHDWSEEDGSGVARTAKNDFL